LFDFVDLLYIPDMWLDSLAYQHLYESASD